MDEQNGTTGRVASLRTWMTDSERFSAEWTAAVQHALDQASTLAAARVRAPGTP